MFQAITSSTEFVDQRPHLTGGISKSADFRFADIPIFRLEPAPWEATLCHDSVES